MDNTEFIHVDNLTKEFDATYTYEIWYRQQHGLVDVNTISLLSNFVQTDCPHTAITEAAAHQYALFFHTHMYTTTLKKSRDYGFRCQVIVVFVIERFLVI